MIAGAIGEYLLVAVPTCATSSLVPFATNGDLRVGPNGGDLPLGPSGNRDPRSDLPPGDRE